MEQSGFFLRPTKQERFRTAVGKRILEETLSENLAAKKFDNEVSTLSNKLGAIISDKLKGLDLPHYKYIVHIVIGEQRGQGVRIGGGCVWDGDTDFSVNLTYTNNWLFCEAIVYAVYRY
ncbi:hypothetical protein AB6A40_008119 [Gnathostoma spinigerum]|uniref:Dynein light chain n=1 Tax=Gnathostoma spinigerum TaxID=75299 RepID=A0ABD6EN60_9BILA